MHLLLMLTGNFVFSNPITENLYFFSHYNRKFKYYCILLYSLPVRITAMFFRTQQEKPINYYYRLKEKNKKVKVVSRENILTTLLH